MRTLALVSLAACFGLPSPSGADTYASGDSWRVDSFEDNCSLAIEYTGETTLIVNYTFGTNSSWLLVIDPTFKSVKEDEKYPVNLIFVKGRHFDDGWGEQVMVGMSIDGVPAIGKMLDARDLLGDIKTRGHTGTYTEGR